MTVEGLFTDWLIVVTTIALLVVCVVLVIASLIIAGFYAWQLLDRAIAAAERYWEDV